MSARTPGGGREDDLASPTIMRLRLPRAALLLALVALAAAFAPSSYGRGNASASVTLVGKLQVIHADFFKAGRATYAYRLHTNHGFVRLHVHGRAVSLAGQRVAAHGI